MGPMRIGAALVFVIGCIGTISVDANLGDCSVCGYAGLVLTARIRGGKEINDPRTFPWMVSLRYSPEVNNCGGAILDEYFILTAAHCVTGTHSNPVNNVKVYFQTDSARELSEGAIIEKFIIHPKYELVQSNATEILFAKYDIALLKLKEKIKCDMYKRPICLPSPDLKIITGKENMIAGWGTPHAGYQGQTEVLNHAILKHLDFENCIKAVPETKMISDHMLCLGGTNQTLCYGDSGSPSFDKINSKYTVVGIASSETDTSCPTSSPVIYTNVVKFVNWIKEQQKAILHLTSIVNEQEESEHEDRLFPKGDSEKESITEMITEDFNPRKDKDFKIKENERIIEILKDIMMQYLVQKRISLNSK